MLLHLGHTSSPFPSPAPTNWFFDTGATGHITDDLSKHSLQHQLYTSSDGVVVGNGSSLAISNSGNDILHSLF